VREEHSKVESAARQTVDEALETVMLDKQAGFEELNRIQEKGEEEKKDSGDDLMVKGQDLEDDIEKTEDSRDDVKNEEARKAGNDEEDELLERLEDEGSKLAGQGASRDDTSPESHEEVDRSESMQETKAESETNPMEPVEVSLEKRESLESEGQPSSSCMLGKYGQYFEEDSLDIDRDLVSQSAGVVSSSQDLPGLSEKDVKGEEESSNVTEIPPSEVFEVVEEKAEQNSQGLESTSESPGFEHVEMNNSDMPLTNTGSDSNSEVNEGVGKCNIQTIEHFIHSAHHISP